MKIVGITGRSGSGKSSVTRYYQSLGFPAVDADAVAREIMLPGSDCLPALQKVFGSDILEQDGSLNRALLAARAFKNEDTAKQLTDITHPAIEAEIMEYACNAEQAGEPLFFVDGAVIVGTPFAARCQRLILVTATLQTSVARICARDNVSEETARQRLAAQMPEERLRQAADFVIENDGTLHQLESKAYETLRLLRKEEHESDTHQ